MVNEPELKDAEFTVKDTAPANQEPSLSGLTPGGWGRKQKTLTFLNVLIMVFIAFAILVAVNFISKRRYFRIDCTFKQEYSISTKSKEILKQLKEPIIIYTFFVQPNDQVMAEIQRMMLDLLEEYKIYSQGKILVESVQPAANPEMVEVLQKKFNIETIAANDMILRSGNNQKNVNLVETYERDEGAYGRSGGLKAFKGEETLTSAIMNIIKAQKTTIYFATGHGEGDIKDNSQDGYAMFSNYLQRENMECKPLSLMEITQIPADCSALVIPEPKSQISPPERVLLNNYLNTGGRVLIMIDPLKESGLNDFLKDWGIKTDEGIILDQEKSMVFFGMKNVTCIIAEDYSNHPITEKMLKEASIFPGARSVESISPTVAAEIVKSSPSSWMETDIDALSKGQATYDKESDRKGPIGIGVAVSKKFGDLEARMVVLGCSNMVRNKFIDPNSLMGFGRVDLALNSIRWLAGQESFITIEPKTPDSKRIEMTQARSAFLLWFSLIIIPAIGAVLGILVWIIRRK